MKAITDNFSTGSDGYAQFRPHYPDALFSWLYGNVRHFSTAWDCGTGNGQVAVRLAEQFGQVWATDISAEQMKHAPPLPNITYLQERAEATSLAPASVDLITIAQAIHWFDFEHFYEEVNRVARKGAIIMAATYGVLQTNAAGDAVIDHLYHNLTHPYWDKERRYIDEAYATIPFPFPEIPLPQLYIEADWTVHQLLGYLRTWSGVKHYIAALGHDPIALIADDLQRAFHGEPTIAVRFPIYGRVGIVG